MSESQEVPSHCPTCRCPTMALTCDRRRYHRSLYHSLFGVAAEVTRTWEALPADQRRVPFAMQVALEGLVQWLAAHPTREGPG